MCTSTSVSSKGEGWLIQLLHTCGLQPLKISPRTTHLQGAIKFTSAQPTAEELAVYIREYIYIFVHLIIALSTDSRVAVLTCQWSRDICSQKSWLRATCSRAQPNPLHIKSFELHCGVNAGILDQRRRVEAELSLETAVFFFLLRFWSPAFATWFGSGSSVPKVLFCSDGELQPTHESQSLYRCTHGVPHNGRPLLTRQS